IAASVLGMWALGVACYRDLYLATVHGHSGLMDKWDVTPLIQEWRTDKWETLSILSIVVPAVLCFVGPFVGALWSRAEGRRAMLAGMTGAFLAILGFPAPLGIPFVSADPFAAVAGVFVVVVSTLPFAA